MANRLSLRIRQRRWTVAAETPISGRFQPTDTAPPKELIAGEKAENSPRFTPDGKHIAFISNRDGVSQVYLADPDGRGVKQITKISGGVQSPLVVSPDGKKIAFVSDVYPQCKDEECNRRTREAQEKDPVKVRLLRALPFRHWDEWRTNIRHHVFVARSRHRRSARRYARRFRFAPALL